MMVVLPVTQIYHYNNIHVCLHFQLITEQKALTRPKPAQMKKWSYRTVKNQPTPTSPPPPPPPTSHVEPLTNEQLWK